jgi:hypothetical protein
MDASPNAYNRANHGGLRNTITQKDLKSAETNMKYGGNPRLGGT